MLLSLALIGLSFNLDEGAKPHQPTNAHHEEKTAPKDVPPTPTKVEFSKTPKPKDDGTSLSLINRPNIDADIKKAILSKDLETLMGLLKGEFTNDAQIFFAPEVDGDRDAAKIFIRITDNLSKNGDEGSLNLKYQLNDENGKTIRFRKWILSLDADEYAIRAKQYDIDPIKPENLTYLKGCDILFQKRGSGFTGRLEKNCKQALNDGRIIDLLERHEIDEKTWEISDLSTDIAKRNVFGNVDGFPTTYKKLTYYVCWAGNYGPKASSTKTDILLHNQGGEAMVKLGTRNIRLRLREIEWPYGNNRPSLTLYLMNNTDELATIYSWSDIGSARIALNYGDIQASCTKK